jgi:hypothetical protein
MPQLPVPVKNTAITSVATATTSCDMLCILNNVSEPDVSVSIVTAYGLDDRVIKVRCPAEAKGVFL